jgi:SAM-dependent methyltransferase
MNKIALPSLVLGGLLVGLLLMPLDGQAQGESVHRDTTEKGAPYVPTPRHVALKMLTLAGVSSDDIVYDLGSGDGRILIIAAQEFGARGVGVEIDPELVQTARRKARRAGVADLVEFRQGDLFETDLSEATVVTLYLWPDMNNRLRPKLQRELSSGDRIVSHSFDIDKWTADTTVTMETPNPSVPEKRLFKWTIPAP